MQAHLKQLLSTPASFTPQHAGDAARLIMTGEATPAQIGAFLVGLKLQGKEEEPGTIAAVAGAMREHARQIDLQGRFDSEVVVDIVGTGGDGQDTFNVSTASGIVAAGCGLVVAKHGNRASSSSCGSADVLEALGCNLNNVTPVTVPRLLQDHRFAFLFSQVFHPAMKNVAAPRREIGVRTIFNLLGPLTNPAKPKRVVIGVYAKRLGPHVAEALRIIGVERAWVVCGEIGLDEISPIGKTFVWSIENGVIAEQTIQPSDFGLPEHPMSAVVGGNAAQNSATMRSLLAGQLHGAVLDFVLLNCASLLYVAGKAADLKDGVAIARDAIKSGRAREVLEGFAKAHTMPSISTVTTKPFGDQKPGTSGLRKRVKVFQQEHYTENFIQSTLAAIPQGPAGATLVVGGDGRYYGKEAIQKIIKIAAGNKVSKLIIGCNGILSTPAASNLIRKRSATGGILLTASHNPGGPDNDFGIKYNISNGGPAPENITDKIYELSKTLTTYHLADIPEVDLSQIRTSTFDSFTVEVVDSVNDYVILMKEIYDFPAIKAFFAANPKFTVLMDSMSGVTGPYARRLLVDELGLPVKSVMNFEPLPDFGGGHPDPNLTYAHDLVERVEKEGISFGAASDGDGDRNMIIGKGVFVNPSDSVAVIAAYADRAIPYFKKTGIKGLARSMPTSASIDRVAKAKGLEIFEVPTGWKFFGNLMDAGRLSICGEESFGTGSDHIREKDGLWAVLAWLSIVAYANQSTPGTGLKEILVKHYKEYGRNFFSRYDYEEVASDGAEKMFSLIRSMVNENRSKTVGMDVDGYKVSHCDDFEYTDPIDGSVSKKQGVRFVFSDGSRIIFRLSGTGSQGATVRLYVEKYTNDPALFEADTQKGIKDLIDVALKISKLKEFTGREEPTVIT
ncbi:Phosphoglucomutase-2 [Irineochytrium annulatum]|nr:Phosphoglucomutase-2 [Irineochytrium annulatum]